MRQIGKKSLVLISALMLVLLAACGGNSSQSSGEGDKGGTINAKIGVISYLTGPGAAYGEAITNGFKLAQKEINEKGKVNIELVIEDSAGKQEQALSASQKLMSDDEIVALLGPTLSTEMNVVGPEADLNGIPIMGTSTTAEGIPQIGEYVFRNSIPEALAIPVAMEKAVKKYDVKKVALIYGNDDVFTKSGFDTMKEEVEKMDLEVVTTQTFQKGQSDYNAQLTKIKGLNPDLILASALYNEGAVIMDQARKMGITVPFVGGNGFNSPEVINIAGKAADGLFVATPWFSEKEDPKVQEFIKKYETEYGKKPDQFAAQAYDALYIMAEGLKNAGEADRDALRDALAEIKDLEGILGSFSFDKDGDVEMDPIVLTIKDGKFQIFE
ncbi:branched-chain amino acid ABC transporter substrate-binding protein [Peribacillus cavernae]|uniref:Branched-chain amino acid ABC transporter substrate-binding protein n=1 Tax=Peribacillus cavernae TaxID=1674310 RepID=A0A3S0TV55_9BACI|nr:ABC transporter substrate-binding protein [Peribacillus cavernae]MDQ0219219.1 branched-chain amino acid transport system substrate-binding protein [Peribacillus cavernae]RUQ28564.1 branched-chain amino acid ABC transporter substrate-binding protein [Peribacillus cavernae]